MLLRKSSLLQFFQENGELPSENGPHKGVQYPFSVNEKVLIRVRSLCLCFKFFEAMKIIHQIRVMRMWNCAGK